jgi:DNA-binding LacI/PurR family transcriptional regulator
MTSGLALGQRRPTDSGRVSRCTSGSVRSPSNSSKAVLAAMLRPVHGCIRIVENLIGGGGPFAITAALAGRVGDADAGGHEALAKPHLLRERGWFDPTPLWLTRGTCRERSHDDDQVAMTLENGAERLRPPVMYDVARLAGVSHQTVSRVLNSHPSVRPATRERVERAITQLGYRRNTAARALVTRSTRTVGVISVDTSNYGPSSTLFAIEGAARAAGYFLNFVSVRQVDREHMVEAIDHLMAAGIEGLVAIAPLRTAVDALRGVSTAVPLVAVEATDLFAESGVVVDQLNGGLAATRHLLDLGHDTVVHVAGPAGWLEAEARERGWRMALGDAGREVGPVLGGDWTARSGFKAGQALAGPVSRREVTAVFVGNDQMALGLVRALHEAGFSVPGDVSVVGFDDIPESAYYQPPLTTLRQDFAEVGRRCIQTLLARISGATVEPLQAIQPELLIRDSTATPPAA